MPITKLIVSTGQSHLVRPRFRVCTYGIVQNTQQSTTIHHTAYQVPEVVHQLDLDINDITSHQKAIVHKARQFLMNISKPNIKYDMYTTSLDYSESLYTTPWLIHAALNDALSSSDDRATKVSEFVEKTFQHAIPTVQELCTNDLPSMKLVVIVETATSYQMTQGYTMRTKCNIHIPNGQSNTKTPGSIIEAPSLSNEYRTTLNNPSRSSLVLRHAINSGSACDPRPIFSSPNVHNETTI